MYPMLKCVNSPRWLMWLMPCLALHAGLPATAQDALKAKAWLDSKNVEIHFYGKVVDQND